MKVYIDTDKHGIIDVSEDLVDGTMVRRSDGVSTFNFSMSNPRRKYDSVFAPNDRVTVVMKRLAWVHTFTGLLNSVPLLSAWPRVVSLSSSCSLKRLQYWYWDSNAAATQEMIRTALAAAGSNNSDTDGGVTNVVLSILKKVVGWPESKVHIARIPDDWFQIAYKVAQQVDERAEEADRLAKEFYATLGGAGSVGSSTEGGGTTGTLINGKLAPGTYGGTSLDQAQCAIVETIWTVGLGMGATTRDCVIGTMTGMQESTLKNLTYGDRDSVGVFQQRPSQGWGTIAQCTNVTYASTQFFKGLLKVGNRTSMSETQACQAVQRSGFPNAYAKWLPLGQAVSRVLSGGGSLTGSGSGATGSGATGSSATGGLGGTGGSQGASTGQALALAGVALVEKYPNIPYSQRYGGTRLDIITKNPPPALDCSSFVQSIMVRTTGGLGGMPRTAATQAAWCASRGSARLTPQQAFNTPGALVFKGSPPGHVEISLGTGNQIVGTGRAGRPARISTFKSPDYYDYGYAVPGLSYPGGIGATNGTAPGGTGSDSSSNAAEHAAEAARLGSSLPGYNPNDRFDKLFGNNTWAPSSPEQNYQMDLAEALTGIRALLNDQPLLPYLKNLFNSTMRSFCSAPNGDLIAWFPDYYGLWGTAAKMIVQPIEVQDFTVEWSDDFFVTHQFTLAGKVNYLDVGSGSVETDFATQLGADIRTSTLGIANIDIPAIMFALFGVDASEQEAKNFTTYIYKRFGARPDYQEMPGLIGPKAEFFSALFMFMRQWAYQYNADIPLTFMPELWPGMLIQIPAFNFQAYVTTVTHQFRFGEGGGFSTTVNIAAPARLPKKKGDRDNVLIGLPLAGDYKPGRGVGNVDPISTEVEGGQFARLPNGKQVPI